MYQPNYEEVKQQIATPAYVFDTDVLKERIMSIAKQLDPRIHLCYAMKANPFIIDSMKDVIDRYEVCSPGEFQICERAGIAMDKVVLSGVYKEHDDIVRIVGQYRDQIVYTSESLQQFYLLNEAALQHGCQIKTLLRITSGNQFGMDEKDLCMLVENRAIYEGVEIIGIQHFSGTQRKRLTKYEEELYYVDGLIKRLEDLYGYVAQELEFGPGFYVEYFQDGKPYDEVALLAGFQEVIHQLHFQGQITLELGRFIASSCGNYYTSIVDSKVNHATSFCIVDGGMHQITYFGQMMAMKIPYYRQLQREQTVEDVTCTICGSLCTVNDNLVKSLPLRTPVIGDILEFQRVGAYAMCEGISLFLSRDLPSVYLYSKQDGLQLQRGRFETNILNYKP